MELKEKYDVVVLGDHIGALLAATLVARLGLSILCLPYGNSARTIISKDGDCLDPESNFLLGSSQTDKESGLLSHCLKRVGLLEAEGESIRRGDGLPQVLVPGARLSLTEQNDAFRREFIREFGEKVSSSLQLASALEESESRYLNYWMELPQRLSLPVNRTPVLSLRELRRSLIKKAKEVKLGEFWVHPRKTVSDLQEVQNDAALAQTFLGLWYGITSHPSVDPKASELFQLIALARAGARFRGGMTAYRGLLTRIGKRLGGSFLAESQSGLSSKEYQLVVKNGRLVGVDVLRANTEEPLHIRVRGGVLGCSLSRARGMIRDQERAWFKRLKTGPTPVGWRFTIALRVSIGAIPSGMSERMIWKEPEAPALEIEVASPSEYGVGSITENSDRMIFLRTMLPYLNETLKPEVQRMTAARMFQQFLKIAPFSESHVLRGFPDFRSSSFNDEVAKVYCAKNLSEIPENLYCYTGEGVGPHSGIEGLYLASDEAYPQFGSFGSCVAGLESVAGLAHRAGLPGPLA